MISASFRPTIVEDFVISIGGRTMAVASESEVEREFAKLPRRLRVSQEGLNAKHTALRLVATLREEMKSGFGAAHRAFRRAFGER